MMLDARQSSNLFTAMYQLDLIGLSLTQPQLGRALGEFRALLEEYAPWYDKTSRKMIQACHFNLCTSGGTSSKIAFAIHFFKEEWARASEEEKTFCPEDA